MPATIASAAPLRVAGTTVLPVLSIQYDPAVQPEISQHSGQQYPTLIAVPNISSRIILEMPFRAAFDTFGFGLTRYTAGNFELFLATWGSLVKNSGSVHTKWILATGCQIAVQITGFQVNQDGILTASVECIPFSAAGVASALTKSDNNALPALASQPVLHTLGPVQIAGTVYPGLTAAQGDLAPRLEVLRADGAPYPIVGARTEAKPTLTLDHADPVALMGLLGDQGVAITANVVAFFRQFTAGTGIIDAGATAVSITVASGRVLPTAISAQQGAIARMGLIVHGLSANDTHPFAVSVAATAPALP